MDINTGKLYKEQEEFVDSNKRISLFLGGVGSGKTHVGVVKSLEFANGSSMIQTPNTGVILAPESASYKHMISEIVPTVDKMLGVKNGTLFNLAKNRIGLPNGSEIFLSTHNYKSTILTNNPDWIWVTHAAFCSFEMNQFVLSYVLQNPEVFLFQTSKPNGKNWFYDFWKNDMQNEDKIMVVAPSSNNPYLDAEILQHLSKYYSGRSYKQNIEAKFVL